MSRPILLLDVDGPCAEFVGHLLQHVASPELTRAHITDYDIFSFLTPDERARAKALLAGPEFWRSLPVTAGAVENVRYLERTFDVVYVSSPWNACEQWYAARRAWLQAHFGPKIHFMAVAAELKHLIRGHVMVEDNVSTLTMWRALNAPNDAVLFTAPWNAKSMWSGARLDWMADGVVVPASLEAP